MTFADLETDKDGVVLGVTPPPPPIKKAPVRCPICGKPIGTRACRPFRQKPLFSHDEMLGIAARAAEEEICDLALVAELRKPNETTEN